MASIFALDLSINVHGIINKLKSELFGLQCPHLTDNAWDNDENTIQDPNIELYTFGCPRIGDHQFKNYFLNKVPGSFRVEANGDLICRTPMFSNYHHAATMPVLLSESISIFPQQSKVKNSVRNSDNSWRQNDQISENDHWASTSSLNHDTSMITPCCTSILLRPTYAQSVLVRQYSGNPQYHGLHTYRNYLESLFTLQEKEKYHAMNEAGI